MDVTPVNVLYLAGKSIDFVYNALKVTLRDN